MNVEQLSQILEIGPRSITTYLSQYPHRVPPASERIGKKLYWNKAEVKKWLDAKAQEEKVLLDAEDLSAVINLSVGTIKSYVNLHPDRLPPITKKGRFHKWKASDVKTWLQKHKDSEENLITIKKLSQLSGLTDATIKLYLSARPHKLPPVFLRTGRKGRSPRWHPDDVNKWLAHRESKSPSWKIPTNVSEWEGNKVPEHEIRAFLRIISKKGFPEDTLEIKDTLIWTLKDLIEANNTSYSDLAKNLEKYGLSTSRTSLFKMAKALPKLRINLEVLAGIIHYYSCTLDDVISVKSISGKQIKRSARSKGSLKTVTDKIRWGLPDLMTQHEISASQLEISLQKYGFQISTGYLNKLIQKKPKMLEIGILLPLVYFFDCQLEDVLIVK